MDFATGLRVCEGVSYAQEFELRSQAP